MQEQKRISPILFENTSKKDYLPLHLDKSHNPAFKYAIELRTSQNKNLKMPSIRKDVGFLDSWLKEMLENIGQRPVYCFNTLIEDLQLIYSACLKELIRQIGLHCVERALLLEKIWNCYIDLLEKAISSSKNEKNQIEKDFLSEISRIFDIFEKESRNYQIEIERLNNENNELKQKNRSHWEELLYLRTKHHRFEKENRVLRDHCDQLLQDLKAMANELYNYQINEGSPYLNSSKPRINSSINKTKASVDITKELNDKNIIETNLKYEEAYERMIEEKGVNTEEIQEENTNREINKEVEGTLADGILQNMQESIIYNPKNTGFLPNKQKISEFPLIVETKNDKEGKSDEKKLNKSIQVDIAEFLQSPSNLVRAGTTVIFDDGNSALLSPKKQQEIIEQSEKMALSTVKSYEKMTKSVLFAQVNSKNPDSRKSQEKLVGLMELGKSNLLENIELKKELLVLKEEINHFNRENKRLRYTYQKNVSELEENKQKNFNLNENVKILEKKVFFLFLSYKIP